MASTLLNPLPIPPVLRPIDPASLSFQTPTKRINSLVDLTRFPESPGYTLLTSFIAYLNASVSPLDATTNTLRPPEDFTTNASSTNTSPEVSGLVRLIESLSSLVSSAPPETGPRRFGNPAFRKWVQLASDELDSKADEYLPAPARSGKSELLCYLNGSFGSAERLDYGTGHELSFAAFVCGIWALGGFEPGRDERAIVFNIFDAYFKLVRRLVTTYTLEPAGSHGVWGLDDHVFLPYIFGSAQLTTYRPSDTKPSPEVTRGIANPEDVVKKDIVDRERHRNLYFDAVGFVYEVKKGPFWEHSPVLYDISGVQKGWGKINEGMLKMYEKEVLRKFPVVQHFPFGSIFKWASDSGSSSGQEGIQTHLQAATRAPWTTSTPLSSASVNPASRAAVGGPFDSTAPHSSQSTVASYSHQELPSSQPSFPAATRVPWAAAPQQAHSTVRVPPTSQPNPASSFPWAPSTSPSSQPSSGQSPSNESPSSQARIMPPPPTTLNTSLPSSQSARGLLPPSPVIPMHQNESPEVALVEEDIDAQPLRTEALLGPKRTSSPDSAVAAKSESRRGSLVGIGTGGVRVAETGDLGELGRARKGSGGSASAGVKREEEKA